MTLWRVVNKEVKVSHASHAEIMTRKNLLIPLSPWNESNLANIQCMANRLRVVYNTVIPAPLDRAAAPQELTLSEIVNVLHGRTAPLLNYP